MATDNRQSPSPPTSIPKYIADGLPKQDTDTLRDIREYVDELIDHNENRTITIEDLPEGAEPVEDDDSSGGQGTIVKEYVTCGDDSCRCSKGGEKHGPYKYRYTWSDGKVKSEYIGKAGQ